MKNKKNQNKKQLKKLARMFFLIWGIFGLVMAYAYLIPSWKCWKSSNYEANAKSNNNIEIKEEIKVLDVPRTHKIEVTQSYSKELTAKITAKITAYSEIDSCHYEGCKMASGIRAYVGAVACPRNIELGTIVEIEGIGKLKCEDRTAKWVEGRFDVFVGYGQESYQKALNFGIKTLKVRIL